MEIAASWREPIADGPVNLLSAEEDGVLSVAIGLAALVWPDATVLVLGLLLGIRMLFFGIAEIMFGLALHEVRGEV